MTNKLSSLEDLSNLIIQGIDPNWSNLKKIRYVYLTLGKYLEKARIWNHIYVLFLVLLGFVLFGTADMAEAGSYVAAMFGMGKLPVVSQEFFYYLRSYAVVLVAGAIGATPLLSSAIARVRKNPAADKIFNVLEILLLAGCLIVVTGYLMEG